MMQRVWTTIISGLALFAMFFGAGNLVFPLLLGEAAGSESLAAVGGLFVTAVLFPLMGLLAMMLFEGDHKSFFGRLGPRSGFFLYLFVQVMIAPAGSLARLFNVAYGSLKSYLPEMIGLPLFGLLACALISMLILHRHRIVSIIGAVLTPVLLVSLISLVVVGLINKVPLQEVPFSSTASFAHGLRMGYNTLDLIASFLFAKMILGHFQRQTADMPREEGRREVMKRFMGASLIAALLLGVVYGGMCYVAAFHLPVIQGELLPEELLHALTVHLLGEGGAIISSVAVALACLTTAISLTAIFSDYLHTDIFKKRIHRNWAIGLTLASSWLIANLGFSEIIALVGPVLEIAYPGLIMLSLLNIFYKWQNFQPVRVPVAATLVLSTATYLV